MKTTTAPAVFAHEFTDNDDPPDARRAFRAHGVTVAEALATLSGPPSRWTYTGTTTRTPYLHHERAAAICAALNKPPGPKWTPRPLSQEYPDCAFYLTRADGLALYMNPPSKYDRPGAVPFHFALSAPRRNGTHVDAYTGTGKDWKRATSPTIGSAATKTPEQMARDITRRLLPLAEIHHAATLARIASLDAADNAQHQTAAAIADACGIELGTDYHTKKPATAGSFDRLDWQAHEGGSATLKLASLPGPLAAQVCRALRDILTADAELADHPGE